MNAGELLQDSLSADANLRISATKQLEDAARDNFPGYVHTLINEFGNEQGDVNIRVAAGIAFKNTVQSRDSINQPVLSQRWLSLPDSVAVPIKQAILSSLGSPQGRVGNTAAQCVSAVAAIELPEGKWLDLIPTLLQFGGQENQNLRVYTLVAIGYICEVTRPEVLSARSNEILTAVVQGARKEEPNVQVQAAAISALYNSLEFIKDNFDREGERNYIMQVVCEATQNPSVDVQVGAFSCLVRIMSLYYEKMDFYMERALFGLTIMGMRNPEETVALQAIEFWSTVCEEEIELAVEAQEALQFEESPSVESRNFARLAVGEILPVLLDLLTQQDEDVDEDDWTRAMASASCLELLAKDIGDDIVQPVVPFVEAGIQRNEWQHREAAVMAFGSILDGPEPNTLSPLVNQAIGALINMLQNDPSMPVRDTVAWTLAKITEVMLDCLSFEMHLQSLIGSLVGALQGPPRIANSCCSALGNMAALQPLGGAAPQESNTATMSPFYPGVLAALMPLSEKPSNESNSRSAAYATIATLVTSSAHDTLPLVHEVVSSMLARQEALMGMQDQLVGTDDRQNWNDIQISICAVLTAAIHRSPRDIAPIADRVMTNLLGLISSAGKHSSVLEDAFFTIGAVASAMESAFIKYMDAFMPFLLSALTSFDDWQVAQAAVYVVSDAARAVGEGLAPYAERIMVALVEILRSPLVNRAVKPNAIGTIGEVALALGPGFVPYLETTMQILSQAGSTAAGENDYAMIEFVWTMREAIVDAFIGIMNGLQPTDPTPFRQYVPGIMVFLRQCFGDEERTDQFVTSSLGLIGDFGSTYKKDVRDDLVQEWVTQAVTQSRQRGSSKQARQNASYAQKAIKELLK